MFADESHALGVSGSGTLFNELEMNWNLPALENPYQEPSVVRRILIGIQGVELWLHIRSLALWVD